MDEPIQEEQAPRPRIGTVVGDFIAAQEVTEQAEENATVAAEAPVGANRINGESNFGKRVSAKIAIAAGQQ